MKEFDIIIIGAGVSGLACALHLDPSLRVALIEKNDCIGKKLAMTGNGRCNITNSNYGKDFLENIYNYKFMYSAFNNFDNFALMELMHKLGVELKEEDHGRMFPTTNKATTIIEAIANNLQHIDLKLNEAVVDITKTDKFVVTTTKQTLLTNKVVIACGGLSYPMTGSDGYGITVAKNFNHKITRLVASEAPLYSDNIICQALQGVTLNNVAIKYNSKAYTGYNLLFTHFGLSGPLALRQCFNIIDAQVKTVRIDFLPTINEEELRTSFKDGDYSILKAHLPKSVVKFFLDTFPTTNHKQINTLVDNLKNYAIDLNKYADVSKGFVTAGGIETSQINNKTFESKLVDNLFFIGEVLNVHAHTGGYNITTFFSMGYNCAINLAKPQH